MPFYSDPSLYSAPLGSYSLYLSGPYSNHSSLIASRTARPNTYAKPLSRFHRGYAPHLSTISENQVNSALRRKYSPGLALHTSSAKYKVPRPIKINTADIDVSADKYKSRVQAATNLDSSKRKKIESSKESSKSPSLDQHDDGNDSFTAKPIRRDRPTVRLRTLHIDEEGKRKSLEPAQVKSEDKEFVLNDTDSSKNKTDKEAKQQKTIQKNPSFHDICTAISQDSVDKELNPGQSDSVKRRQSRTFSNEDFSRQHSADCFLKNDCLQERIFEDKQINKKEDKVQQKIDFLKDEHKFDSRGSVKKKKKVTKKKTNESLLSDDEVKCTVQRKASKKYKRAETDRSIKSDISDGLETDYQEAIRDISNVEVEEIKVRPRPLISATVDLGETIQSKPNLKLIVDDVKVEEVPRTPAKVPKFKFNVTVNVENDNIYSKLNGVPRNGKNIYRTKITDANKGKVHLPKANNILVSQIRHHHQRASLGDKFDHIEEISKINTDKNKLRKEICVSKICETPNSKLKQSDVIPKKEIVVSANLAQSHNNLHDKSIINLNDIFTTGSSQKSDEKNTLLITNEINNLKKQTKPLSSSDEIKEKAEEMRKKQEYKLSALNSKNKVNIELNNIQNNKYNEHKSKLFEINTKTGKSIKKIGQNIITPEQNTKQNLTDVKPVKKEGTSSPGTKCTLPSKEDNASTENFWDLIGTRESVYIQPANVFKRNPVYTDDLKESVTDGIINDIVKKSDDEEVKEKVNCAISSDKCKEILHGENNVNYGLTANKNVLCDSDIQDKKDEEVIPRKMVSKGSLVNKPMNDDPDLNVFIVPAELEQQKKPEPQSPESAFTPLQSNRLSQWMHPFKKPEQYDECPVEIFARPKPIKGRHYPRPRDPPPHPQPLETSESDDGSDVESTEDETDDTEETSSDNEGNAGKSTSSIDSGFNSTNGNPAMQMNKVSSDTRDSPTSNPAHNPAFALDTGDTLEEYYNTSSTFAGFQKSGRITPPATTIPRFRKYNLEDFNFLKVLGKGSFGKVLLAELKDTEYYYAIKCLKKDVVLEDDDVECTLIERKVLALATKHPYLCHLLCTFQTESHLFFVMEYLNGGDLMFHIQHSGRFPEARARAYGAEIVSGLKFLHSKGIVYRDLKLDNILLDFDGHVRIADFGMCKLQIFLDRTADTFCGTPDYMAPEIIKGQHYNQCVDWWSFGVLLYEMLIGQSPFSGCDEDELFWSICNEKPVLPRFLSSEATSILKQLLEKDASKRLGNKMSPHGEIHDHVFFRSISWDLLEKRQLEAPFKPNLQHPLDTQYFDKTFTVEKAKLTPIDKNILQSMDQMQFQGFSYTNPNATDR